MAQLQPSEHVLEVAEVRHTTRTRKRLHSGSAVAATDHRCIQPRLEPRSSVQQDTLPGFACGICLEEVAGEDVYCIDSCQHRFCRPCLTRYTHGLISEHRFPLRCPQPGCSNNISTTQVSELLGNQQDVDTLQRLEVESCIPDSSKFYCPNPSCSMLLIVDEPEIVKQQQQQPSRCPACRETVCVACRVVWHDNLTCSEYQSLPTEMRRPEDTERVTLQAKDAGWKACPRCRTMVELAHGCYHIVCNCGCNWCYKCGNAWSGVEAGCGCLLWDRENVALEETFRTQHYQAHGQDESHARQMAAADLVKYGLAAAAVPPPQPPQAPWTAQSSAVSQPQQQHSSTSSDGSVEFSSIARHLFGPQQPLEYANRFVPPLALPALAPQAVAAALGFAPLQQQRLFPAAPQPQNFPFHSLPAEAPHTQDSHANLLQQQQLLAHLRALEASQHPQPLGPPAGLKPAAPNVNLPPGHLPASAAWLAAVENRQASQQQQQHYQPGSAPAVGYNQQAAQQTAQPAAQQQASSRSSGRAHHRSQQLVAQQMQAAAWAAHVQAATEHMQYAMYSQQRAQVHASLHAQLQAQMDFDEQQDQQEQQRETEQQLKTEAATLLSIRPTPPAPQQHHPAVKQQHPGAQQQHPAAQQYPAAQQQHPAAQQQHPAAQQHTLVRGVQSAAPHKLPQDADLQHLQRHGTQQFGSPQHQDDNSVGSAEADTHHSVASSPTSDSCADGAHVASGPHPQARSGTSTPAFPASLKTTGAATGAASAVHLAGLDTH